MTGWAATQAELIYSMYGLDRPDSSSTRDVINAVETAFGFSNWSEKPYRRTKRLKKVWRASQRPPGSDTVSRNDIARFLMGIYKICLVAKYNN